MTSLEGSRSLYLPSGQPSRPRRKPDAVFTRARARPHGETLAWFAREACQDQSVGEAAEELADRVSS
jgi:hypothetical protein